MNRDEWFEAMRRLRAIADEWSENNRGSAYCSLKPEAIGGRFIDAYTGIDAMEECLDRMELQMMGIKP